MLKTLRIIIISAALLTSAVTSFAAEPCLEPKAECLEYVREAAEQGNAEAQYNLGEMYYKGEGVAEDKQEALRWVRLAAEQGHANAQYVLGLALAEDKQEALRWLRLSAEQGHVKAQGKLGVAYYEGRGVAEDKREAARWFQLVAEQGDMRAQHFLAGMYSDGDGVAEDKREAARWYRLAAEQGYAEAQLFLGAAYFLGQGVIENQREAYIWYLIAKASGSEKADEFLQNSYWQSYLTSVGGAQSAKLEATQRFEIIENRKNSAKHSDNDSSQKGGGEFAVAKPPEQTDVAAEVFENTWRSVVVVKDSEGQGSGVIIRPNMVATNCHVIEGGDIIVYKPENRRINESTPFSAEVIHRNEKDDFCVLEVKGLWGIAATIRKYRTLKIGENVYALGAPRGLDLSLSNGLISQLRTDGDARFIQTDAAISPGSSGGGLFDKEGNFIGILTSKYADEQTEGIGFAIPADLVLKF